jgi:hypothetical protein
MPLRSASGARPTGHAAEVAAEATLSQQPNTPIAAAGEPSTTPDGGVVTAAGGIAGGPVRLAGDARGARLNEACPTRSSGSLAL